MSTRYFAWETNRCAADTFALWSLPEGLGSAELDRLFAGKAMISEWPKDATMRMRKTPPERRNLKPFLSHAEGLCLASKDAQEAIRQLCTPDDVELLPFTLLNDRKKEVSREYAVVHPRRIIDAVDPRTFTKQWHDRVVVSAAKLESAPAFFRLRGTKAIGARGLCVLASSLVRAFQNAGFDNLFLIELAVE